MTFTLWEEKKRRRKKISKGPKIKRRRKNPQKKFLSDLVI